MNVIKFSHHYKKMPVQLNPTWIESIDVKHYNDLDPKFIEEDTETMDGKFYSLPRIKLIIIYLYTIAYGKTHRWQTIRPWNAEKEKYYRNLVDKEVIIEIMKGRERK